MAVTYTTITTGTDPFISSYRVGATVIITRGYMRFDLSGSGEVEANISSVVLRIRVVSVAFESAVHVCRSATGVQANWGSALDATEADYTSTSANGHDQLTISGTGFHNFSIDKTLIDWDGENWFRIATITGGVRSTTNIASQENTTPDFRPSLRVTQNIINAVDGGVLEPIISPIIEPSHPSLLGMGKSGGNTNVYNGSSTDGSVRAEDLTEPFPEESL